MFICKKKLTTVKCLLLDKLSMKGCEKDKKLVFSSQLFMTSNFYLFSENNHGVAKYGKSGKSEYKNRKFITQYHY